MPALDRHQGFLHMYMGGPMWSVQVEGRSTSPPPPKMLLGRSEQPGPQVVQAACFQAIGWPGVGAGFVYGGVILAVVRVPRHMLCQVSGAHCARFGIALCWTAKAAWLSQAAWSRGRLRSCMRHAWPCRCSCCSSLSVLAAVCHHRYSCVITQLVV